MLRGLGCLGVSVRRLLSVSDWAAGWRVGNLRLKMGCCETGRGGAGLNVWLLVPPKEDPSIVICQLYCASQILGWGYQSPICRQSFRSLL